MAKSVADNEKNNFKNIEGKVRFNMYVSVKGKFFLRASEVTSDPILIVQQRGAVCQVIIHTHYNTEFKNYKTTFSFVFVLKFEGL